MILSGILTKVERNYGKLSYSAYSNRHYFIILEKAGTVQTVPALILSGFLCLCRRIGIEALVKRIALFGHIEQELWSFELRSIFPLQPLGDLNELRCADTVNI